MRRSAPRYSGTPRTLFKGGIAALLAFVLAITSMVGLSNTAQAATPGLSANLLLNGQQYDGNTIVAPGDSITLRVQYNTQVEPGSTVVFDVGGAVDPDVVPELTGNAALQDVHKVGNRVSITFADPWPTGINQGVFDLTFKVTEVENSAIDTITWTIDGEETSVPVVVRKPGDQFAIVSNSTSKGVNPNQITATVDNDGNVTLPPNILERDFTYTLRVNSAEAREGLVISDTLPAGMAYVADSFSGSEVSWDENGLNRTTSSFPFTPTVTGNTFTATIDTDAQTELTLTYKARVTDRAALEAALQTAHDDRDGQPGNFQVSRTNTVTFGAEEKSATVNFRGNIAGVDVGSAFAKSSDWSTRNVNVAEDGTLTPAQPITYQLRANLTLWDERNQNFTLGRNVVITDTLVDQATWLDEDPDFISVTGYDGNLTPASPAPADLDAFEADA